MSLHCGRSRQNDRYGVLPFQFFNNLLVSLCSLMFFEKDPDLIYTNALTEEERARILRLSYWLKVHNAHLQVSSNFDKTIQIMVKT